MQQPDSTGGIKKLIATLNDYLKLLLEDTKLNFAEKLTRLLSAAALFLMLAIVGLVALVFLSIAVIAALSTVMSTLWAAVIVALCYIALLAALYFGRTALIVNPIARFISSILLDPPTDNTPSSNA